MAMVRRPRRSGGSNRRAPEVVPRSVRASELARVIRWFAESGSPQGIPFYCDPKRVGTFAVAPADLAAGCDKALYRVFVTLSMYQARRDVLIMRHQRALPRVRMLLVADATFVERSVGRHECPVLRRPESFERDCDVWKKGDIVDCNRAAGAPCHVKDATAVFNRMGDMGKLPTSAWLRLWKDSGVRALVAKVCREEPSPTRRATILVERFATVHRVGRKLEQRHVS
jgi:hypothetical protein